MNVELDSGVYSFGRGAKVKNVPVKCWTIQNHPGQGVVVFLRGGDYIKKSCFLEAIISLKELEKAIASHKSVSKKTVFYEQKKRLAKLVKKGR